MGCLQNGIERYGLGLYDAFVLSELYDIIANNKTNKCFNKDKLPYFYFSTKMFVESYPSLKLKQRKLQSMLKKYCDLRILEKANQYLPCSGKHPFYTAPHYRFTKEAYGQLFGHKNQTKKNVRVGQSEESIDLKSVK